MSQLVPLKVADSDYFRIGLCALWKRIERGQMPVALYRQGRRWHCLASDLTAWQQAGGWGMEVPQAAASSIHLHPDIPDLQDHRHS
ncbi:MAG: hypothetical protein U1A72_20390 [Sulfuritalea sp.]|nr:hypothetical protein [Sulfuritalea sp.]